jgi:hypothetical protein
MAAVETAGGISLESCWLQMPIYARKVWDQKMPDQGKPAGHDLMVGDWVQPNNAWLHFSVGCLNPEPNSRNMEFDPRKNRFKNLQPLE